MRQRRAPLQTGTARPLLEKLPRTSISHCGRFCTAPSAEFLWTDAFCMWPKCANDVLLSYQSGERTSTPA